MQYLTLFEYQTTTGVPLSPAERDALRAIAPSVAVTPSVGYEGLYDLQPGSWIGSINLGSLTIEIRPKLPIDRVLFLISYALAPERWAQTGFSYEENSLLEAVIPGFVHQVQRALRQGILQGYRMEEAALPTVRGRLRFDEQIRERYGLFPPAEVRYDEFTEDIEENRIIKAAIARLSRMRIRSDIARRMLRAFDGTLGLVRQVDYDPRQLPRINYTRLNAHYRPAIDLSVLILRSASFELKTGAVRATAFLVDMNEVFENFVVVALREALKLSERVFPQGAEGRALALDEAWAVRLLPDISWWEGNRCVFVGDVKYKRVNVEGIRHPDLYQMLAYTVATGLPGGLLIYAAGEAEPMTHRVVYLGKEIEVVALDVSGSAAEILAGIDEVAARIRWLKQWALTERDI